MSSKNYFDVNDTITNKTIRLFVWILLIAIFAVSVWKLSSTLVITRLNLFLVVLGWFFSNMVSLSKFIVFRPIKSKTFKEINNLDNTYIEESEPYKTNGLFKYIKSERERIKIKEVLLKRSTYKKILQLLLSPDYVISKQFKKSLNKSAELAYEKAASKSLFKFKKYILFIEKEALKYLIINSNLFNLSISFLLVLLTIIFTPLIHFKLLTIVMCSFIFFRIMHRSFEVIPAFYYDVVNKNVDYKGNYYKKSNLKKGHRIALGFKTIIELSLLNGLLYYFMFNLGLFTLEKDTGRLVGLFEFILYSTSVSQVANVSFELKFSLLQQIVHVLQNTVTLIIVAFSISYYLGNDDRYTPYELEHLRRVNRYEKENGSIIKEKKIEKISKKRSLF